MVVKLRWRKVVRFENSVTYRAYVGDVFVGAVWKQRGCWWASLGSLACGSVRQAKEAFHKAYEERLILQVESALSRPETLG